MSDMLFVGVSVRGGARCANVMFLGCVLCKLCVFCRLVDRGAVL